MIRTTMETGNYCKPLYGKHTSLWCESKMLARMGLDGIFNVLVRALTGVRSNG